MDPHDIVFVTCIVGLQEPCFDFLMQLNIFGLYGFIILMIQENKCCYLM